MLNFEKTNQDAVRFDEFISKTEKAIDKLSPYSDIAKLSKLESVRDGFKTRIDDFFRAERKLNIGIIGQVKAGKSSFLNTLLFDGQKVLPSAATPKTATLTKIEYAEENTLEVEYYTPDEWKIIEKNSVVESPDGEFESAREIMSMIKSSGINPDEYTVKGGDSFHFDSVNSLMSELNDYVGENGKYTPLVKNVTIKMAKDELRDISVVDTPGLNDAIASRTDKTREFIEKCDVVFFLSPAARFLDKNDIHLLVSQLPQKGVEKIIMLCSRFDQEIDGVYYDNDLESLPNAIEYAKEKMTKQAVSIIKAIKSPELAEKLEPCKNPIFLSSMCWNMSQKTPEEYDKYERLVFDKLSDCGDVDSDLLRQIGNIETIRAEFEKVVAEKDETLSAKSRNFLPNAEKDYASALNDIRTSAEKTLEILRTGDREQLEKASKQLSSQINGIRGETEIVFGDVLQRLEATKNDTLRKLREASHEFSRLNERTGTEEHVSKYKVSDFKLFHPSTWGKSHYEYSTYTTSYSYLETSDALENIRLLSDTACSDIENAFYESVNITDIKKKLLSVIVEYFDTSSDTYDPALLRLITQETINSIQFPVMKLDVSEFRSRISSKFSGEVRNSSDRSALRTLLSETISSLLDKITESFTQEIVSFRADVEKYKNSFSDKLLDNIQSEFDNLKDMLANKDKEIKTYETFLTLLKTV